MTAIPQLPTAAPAAAVIAADPLPMDPASPLAASTVMGHISLGDDVDSSNSAESITPELHISVKFSSLGSLTDNLNVKLRMS